MKIVCRCAQAVSSNCVSVAQGKSARYVSIFFRQYRRIAAVGSALDLKCRSAASRATVGSVFSLRGIRVDLPDRLPESLPFFDAGLAQRSRATSCDDRMMRLEQSER